MPNTTDLRDPHDDGPNPPTISTAMPLVRCEPGQHGPRIIIQFEDKEEWPMSIARAAQLRVAIIEAIAQGFAEVKRRAKEREAKP